MIKKIWLLLILLIIILIFFTKILKTKKTYTHYLVLGDSIAEGYSLKDRNKRYSKLVCKKYNIQVNNYNDLSKSGMTANELSININNPEYIDSIEKSDLITISIGSNELLGVFTQIVQKVMLYNSTSDINTLSKKLAEELQNTNSQKAFQEGIDIYEKSWDIIIEKIKSTNPNATIVVTEFYNPYYDIEEIGSIADSYIKQLNEILHDKSKNETVYSIAKIYEDFKNPEMNCTNVDKNAFTANSFNINSFDPHPNINGHRIISDKIIHALSNK